MAIGKGIDGCYGLLLSCKHTERQAAASAAKSHWNALWRSKIGPRPIPKRQPKCQNFKATAAAAPRCVYTLRRKGSDSHYGNLKIPTFPWHIFYSIDVFYIILPSSRLLIWFCMNVRTFLWCYKICPERVSPKCSVGDVNKINVGGFIGKNNNCQLRYLFAFYSSIK